MKRIIVRLSALSGVIVLGWIAIAQAQRAFESHSAPQEPAMLPTTPAESPTPKPIPLAAGEEPSRTGNDLFGNRRAVQRTALAAEPIPEDRYGGNRYAGARAVENAVANEIPPAREALDANQVATDQPQEPRGYRLRGGAPKVQGGDPFATRAASADMQERYAPSAAAQESASEPTPAPASLPAASDPRLQAPPLTEIPSVNQTSESADNFAPPRSLERYSNVPPADAAPLQSPSDGPIAGAEGSGRPGAQQLEGPQAPTLTIEKTAPAEISVGKPATFAIRVRNTGSVVAQGVEIHDQVPKGTQLVSATPRASRGSEGGLVFELGTLKPGDEATAQVQLMPLAEGEIGSLATVHFRAEASVRTVATKPELRVELSAPPKVMIGADVPIKIKVTNPGSGAATGVVLTENVPTGLKHAAGDELELEVGTLKPGESRDLELTLTAATAGQVTNTLTARGDANLKSMGSVELEVIAPALKVGLSGPKRRFLERNAVYSISVSNPGTAPAKDIELVSTLPRGLKFVEANNAGQYDPTTHSVYWSLEELPPQESGTVTLTTLPIEPGDLKLQVKGQARQGLSDQQEDTITVDGLAAVQFELVDVNDPIEVNGQTTYEIRVTNSGSKAATNLRLVALVPPEMKPLAADGPARYVIDGQRVLFDPVRQLAPKADTSYTVKVQGLQPGDLRIRVQIVTDEIRTPLTKEESTRVYADE